MRFTDPKCRTCGCEGQGETVEITGFDGRRQTVRHYDPPLDTCGCECHEAWRFIFRRPASAVAA